MHLPLSPRRLITYALKNVSKSSLTRSFRVVHNAVRGSLVDLQRRALDHLERDKSQAMSRSHGFVTLAARRHKCAST